MPAIESGNESVTEEYLNKETLVLCVVDADSETLGSGNAALHAINMAGKLQQTILVLTKADKVDQDEVEEALFDRVLKTAAECQHFDQLKGVVAVILTQSNPKPLYQASVASWYRGFCCNASSFQNA